MANIRVLSFEIANLIAAGEVVERPASVLKELIENSIDAGATAVTAEIKHGGVSLIRVTDNGCGIGKEDLPVALKRHATSKIKDKEDLAGILTLGFRGEALAAISSVSKVTIISRTPENEYGNMLTSEAGTVTDVTEVSCAIGTTVLVEDLFYNVPARRKFLKKDSTEAMNVSAMVEKVALSRPDISLRLLVDGEEKFRTPGDGKLINAIYAVLGRDFAGKVIPVDGEAGKIHVHGYIGRSDNVRKNRNLENFFINGRFVKSLTAGAAVEKAFTSYIAPEMFPACVLNIDLSYSQVDVNVHPSKLEVKFSDERSVFEAVYYTVRSALTSAEYRPELSVGKDGKPSNYVNAFVPIGEDTKGQQIGMSRDTIAKAFEKGMTAKDLYESKFSDRGSTRPDTPRGISFSSGFGSAAKSEGTTWSKPRETSATMTPKDSLDVLKNYRKAEPAESIRYETKAAVEQKPTEVPKPIAEEVPALPSNKFVGEAFDTYVMVELENELLVIDKHAAH
ncbi:MAG: DNA mismatch repair endonuclease MutL, partial [Clostridia bacterium]|nr:DNA mismatch repair endonuclease MutL [Clostridia bacterium]